VEYATEEKELYELRGDSYELTNSYDRDTVPSGLAPRLHALESCAGDACRTAEGGTQ
jgi:hypothetical protein